ncbi:MAG TPA: UvrD-helicase domain-containing protein, partial [Blastocatellia bacterium]|nr:UvrD-helicase domain-containing protein [Blastocatellia bacterium]
MTETALPASNTHELNPKQLEAAGILEGPALVLAGAGSGKTRVITQRIAHLIETGSARPDQILAVTFTNKAADEMKSRVDKLLGAGIRQASPLISTFHSLCVRILRRDVVVMDAGYTRDFTIYDADDQVRLVRTIRKELSLEEKSISDRSVVSTVSWAKSRGVSPAGYSNQAEYASSRREQIATVYGEYQQRLHKANAMDFDDLLIQTVELLRRAPDVRARYHDRFRHVMIDEFQDTNSFQYEMARLIVTNTITTGRANLNPAELWRNRSLFVVGDIDQSIYSFRGSDFNIILGFQKDFEGTRTIKLEQNYRSTQNILEAANRVIENNARRLPKTLYATKELGAGDKIGYYQSYDGEGEASFVAQKAAEHLKRAYGARVAVLYRANSQSRLFE